MKFDFVEFKDSLVELEQAHKWDIVLDKLRAAWDETHDSNLAALCVDECFLLIEWADEDMPPEPSLQPCRDGYQELLNDVVDYGLDHFWDQPYFLWRLGFWMKNGAGPSYMFLNGKVTVDNMEELAKKILETAYQLWPSILVQCSIEHAYRNSNWDLYTTTEQKEEAFQELKKLNLRKNMADDQIEYDYTWITY